MEKTKDRNAGRRVLRAITWIIAAVLLLSACGAAPNSATNAPTPSTDAPSTRAGTGQAAVLPTAAPPTAVPRASTAAPPTAAPRAPTAAPPTTAPRAPTVVPPTAMAPTPTAAPPTAVPSAPTARPASAIGSEILYLKGGALLAYDPATRKERTLAPQVSDFAATPDGRLLALLRGTGRAAEIWTVARDGSDLRQMTRNKRAEGSLSWAPDGLTLAYASADSDSARPLTWQDWAAWCSSSEVRLLDMKSAAENTLTRGCDPSFSPDGLRIAFASAPSAADATGQGRTVANAVRLVNRKGQNGWNFATAGGNGAESGLLVYAPAWSPDAAQVAYQRFMGYQALVDINLTEMGASLEGQGKLLATGAGWMFPPLFAPDGRMLAVIENNYSDARGFSGYDVWSVQVLRLGETSDLALPSGTYTTQAARMDKLPRATSAAWNPDSSALAVLLPTGWKPDAPTNEPTYDQATQGELWRWTPGQQPAERLVQGVDFASPLLWLPPPPRIEVSPQGYRLAYPADWQLAPATEFEERSAIAADKLRLISAAPLPNGSGESVTQIFPAFVAPGAKEDQALAWPDGSRYRAFRGTTPEGKPVTGAMRIVTPASGPAIALLYRSSPERWPLERASAQALLAAGGP